MTTETARLVANVLARRLGIEAEELHATLTDNPLGAALALSMLEPARQAHETDPAAVVRFVAAMVGACPVCLGEEESCGDCHGVGKPGTRASNPEALIRWVALPLHQAGLCVGRPRSTPEANNHLGGYVR